MTIKRKDRSYNALDINNIDQQQQQIYDQQRKLSFNPELIDQQN